VDILSLSFIRNRRFSLRTGVIQVSPITALVLNGPWLRRKSLLINVIYEWSKITGSHRRHASPRDANNAISRPSVMGQAQKADLSVDSAGGRRHDPGMAQKSAFFGLLSRIHT
jgi:hypothetical protein